MEQQTDADKIPVKKESLARRLGINRTTVALLAVIGGLGLSEEIWRNFLAIHLKDAMTGDNPAAQVLSAAWFWLRVNCEPDVLSL